MKRIIIIGESMLELSSASAGLWQQSFAGDVHSFAVYLKRCAPPELTVSFMSAVGTDAFSAGLIIALQQEKIDTSLIYQHPSKNLGLYMIHNSPSGERSFQYWRNDSAAKEVMHLQQTAAPITAPEQLFFSGISLAILTNNSRELFWEFIRTLKQQGTQIIFDPNYREKLWSSVADCKSQYELAFQYCDLILPGVEDFTALYQLESSQAVCDFLAQYPIAEMVIKNGAEAVVYQTATEQKIIAITPVQNVVDTTAAGDSFNGSYIAARARGMMAADAIRFAAQVSTIVIQHKGAILDQQLFPPHLFT